MYNIFSAIDILIAFLRNNFGFGLDLGEKYGLIYKNILYVFKIYN